MIWIAPAEKDTGPETLEDRLWKAADEAPRQFRPDLRSVFTARSFNFLGADLAVIAAARMSDVLGDCPPVGTVQSHAGLRVNPLE
jgi:hypothetical protein